MNKRKTIFTWILIVGTLIEGIILIINTTKESDDVTSCISTDIVNEKTIEEINEELNQITNGQIISCDKYDNRWSIKLKVEGEKKEIENTINDIDNFIINGYNIECKEGYISLEFDFIEQ